MNQKPTHKLAEYHGSKQYDATMMAASKLIVALSKYQHGIEKLERAEVLLLRQTEIVDKIADIELLLPQIKYLLKATAEVTRLKDKKLQHQLVQIEKNVMEV